MRVSKLSSLFIALGLSTPAVAQSCYPREVVLRVLADPLQQSRKTQALDAAGNLVEQWADEFGAWTLTLTNAGGTTCVLGDGQVFEIVDEPLPPAGEDG